MARSGVYAFVNKTDGMRYVGQSRDIDGRRSDHLSMLRRGKHSNRRFQRAADRNAHAERIRAAKAEKFADPAYRAAISQKLKDAWARRKQPSI